jgi:hypothetical protein
MKKYNKFYLNMEIIIIRPTVAEKELLYVQTRDSTPMKNFNKINFLKFF